MYKKTDVIYDILTMEESDIMRNKTLFLIDKHIEYLKSEAIKYHYNYDTIIDDRGLYYEDKEFMDMLYRMDKIEDPDERELAFIEFKEKLDREHDECSMKEQYIKEANIPTLSFDTWAKFNDKYMYLKVCSDETLNENMILYDIEDNAYEIALSEDKNVSKQAL